MKRALLARRVGSWDDCFGGGEIIVSFELELLFRCGALF